MYNYRLGGWKIILIKRSLDFIPTVMELSFPKTLGFSRSLGDHTSFNIGSRLEIYDPDGLGKRESGVLALGQMNILVLY